jgi:hypothetical protein
LEDILDVKYLSSGPIGLFGNKASLECELVVWVEATPKYGIVFALGHSSCFEEWLAEGVEVMVVIDDVGFFFHVQSRRLVCKFDQFLLRIQTLVGGVEILTVQVVAEFILVVLYESWQGLPNMAL